MSMIKSITIHAPIWKGGRFFGIARYKMSLPVLEVTCDYKNKQGELVMPGRYQILTEKAVTYPAKYVKGTKLHVIPVADFLEVEEPMFKIKVSEDRDEYFNNERFTNG